MSGICGLLRLDGGQLEQAVLERMTDFLKFRGPDAQSTWSQDCIGLGHTLLRTTSDCTHEKQPLTLDGNIWIAADARIDGQQALRDKLAARGRRGLAAASDAELILHAYHAWGDDCLSHLIGDFAFAVWDGPKRRLLCARDHFGVKPFFYALPGREVVFSNTLDGIRIHPRISRSLNDLAIADLLLFESNQDPGTTAFADIKRLPPAHYLVCSAAGVEVKRYWSLPAELGVRYRSNGDYVEHFRMLMEQAVLDRMRTSDVGVSMSGGLDSTAVAAVAKNVLSQRPGAWQLRAHAVVFDRLIPDTERHFASLAAAHLGVPLHCLVADDYALYAHQEDPDGRLPEPLHNPDFVVPLQLARQAARHCRVMLTGWDGDALLNESPKPYLRSLLSERRLMAVLATAARYQLSQRRLVPLTVRKWFRRDPRVRPDAQSEFPVWISKELDRRLGLRARWDEMNSRLLAKHPVRPYAYRTFNLIARYSNFFETYDAGITRCPVEFRHPLMDLRLLEYCLSLPPVPWCVKKEILRLAMQGLLPDTIRQRPKTPWPGSPHLARLQVDGAQWIDAVAFEPSIAAYVDTALIPTLWGAADADDSWKNLRPLRLDFWMKSLRESRLTPTAGIEQCCA
jgi:asparagine synthase (glutamine-hydrolysing)